MRKWFRNVLAAILVIIAMISVARLVLWSPADPIYRGQRLSIWLSETWSDETDEAVRHLGNNAIPRLLNLLRASDSKLKLKLMRLSQRQHLIRFHFITASERHTEALLAFRALGSSASNAVPDLIGMYSPTNSLESQTAILASLGFIGPSAKSAIPLLLRVTASSANNLVLKTAFVTLSSIASEPEIVIPAMTKLLHDPRVDVRFCAARTLGDFGPNARLATSGLLESFEDADSRVRDQALNSLRQIYAKPQWLVISEPIPGAKPKFMPYDLIRVINGFSAMGTNAEPAVPALVKFLTDPDQGVRVSATNTLKAVAPSAAARAGIK